MTWNGRRRAEFESIESARRYFKSKALWEGWDPLALEGYIRGVLKKHKMCESYGMLAGGLSEGDDGVWRLCCNPWDEAALFASVYDRDEYEELVRGNVLCPVCLHHM